MFSSEQMLKSATQRKLDVLMMLGSKSYYKKMRSLRLRIHNLFLIFRSQTSYCFSRLPHFTFSQLFQFLIQFFAIIWLTVAIN
jgi:hypothetical protein